MTEMGLLTAGAGAVGGVVDEDGFIKFREYYTLWAVKSKQKNYDMHYLGLSVWISCLIHIRI